MMMMMVIAMNNMVDCY